MGLFVCVFVSWAARYNTWLLIELMPQGVIFSFLFCVFVCVCVLSGGQE